MKSYFSKKNRFKFIAVVILILSQIFYWIFSVYAKPTDEFLSSVTVQIKRKSSNTPEVYPSGTGFLVGQYGSSMLQRYVVMTVAHNLDTNIDGKIDNNDEINSLYTVMTNDGKIHQVTSYEYLITKELKQLDLAIISFKSDNQYSTIDINNGIDINENFIEKKLYIPGYSQSAVGLRIDQCTITNIYPAIPSDSPLKYGIPTYDNDTYFSEGYTLNCIPNNDLQLDGGMSGSPMFDENGRLIAIFGRKSNVNNIKKGISVDIINDSLINTSTTFRPTYTPKPTPTFSVPKPTLQNNIIVEKYGELRTGDKILPTDNSLYDEHSFEGKKGQTIKIKAESKDFDTYLAIFTPAGDLLAEHDDISEQNSNSEISVTLPVAGTYRIIINAYDKDSKGDYILQVIEE